MESKKKPGNDLWGAVGRVSRIKGGECHMPSSSGLTGTREACEHKSAMFIQSLKGVIADFLFCPLRF